MSRQTISVVIPSYNYEKFLPQAVQSVAFQTYPDIELVIVDDASSDGSPALIRGLAEEHGRRFTSMQTIFLTENKGAHAAINTGIRAAKGAYVSILNADDLYEPERFSVMMEALGNGRFAFSRVACIDADGGRLETDQARRFELIQQKLDGKRVTALAALGENVAVSTGNMLLEKSLFDALGGFRNYKYVHDYDFFLRACLVTEPMFVPGTSYLYRLHGGNSFTRLGREGLVENRLVWLDIYGMVNRGEVSNPAILENPDYKEEFFAAAAQESDKKRTLWKLSKNPAVRGLTAIAKKIYRV